MLRASAAAAVALLSGAAALPAPAVGQAAGTTERVSLGPGGVEGNNISRSPAVTPDGRFVAFASTATNLVARDTNNRDDVFVRDRRSGRTERVSLGPGGVQGNGGSFFPAISSGGGFVAFTSVATNLVPGDTNRVSDVFVRDRRTARTERVSVGTGGIQGDGDSAFFPAISANGRFVAFESRAGNLVPGDTNGASDLFVRDRRTGRTERVSVGSGGRQADGPSFHAAISADGRFVAFESRAGNLVPGDTNGWGDVFVRDRVAGTTERVSVGAGGAQADAGSFSPALSASGRFVAFASDGFGLVPEDTNSVRDVFVRDRRTDETLWASAGLPGSLNAFDSSAPAISPGGRFVAFESGAANLVPGDTNDTSDVFVRNLDVGRTERVSVGPRGAQGDDSSFESSVSIGARFVAFVSEAGNLVPGDANGQRDIFVRVR